MYQQKITRKIFQTGKYSYIISLPKELFRHLGWQRGDVVEVDLDKSRKRLIIKKHRF